MTEEHKQRRYRRDEDQVRTVTVSIEDIMLRKEFRQGVADARAGRPPRYDGDFELMPLELPPPGDPNCLINRQWSYERGRQFGIVAPRDLHVILPRAKRLNPKAVTFYWMQRFGARYEQTEKYRKPRTHQHEDQGAGEEDGLQCDRHRGFAGAGIRAVRTRRIRGLAGEELRLVAQNGAALSAGLRFSSNPKSTKLADLPPTFHSARFTCSSTTERCREV